MNWPWRKRPPVIEYWEGPDGRWYIHVLHRNGHISDLSSYAYKRGAVAKARRDYPGIEVRERVA